MAGRKPCLLFRYFVISLLSIDMTDLVILVYIRMIFNDVKTEGEDDATPADRSRRLFTENLPPLQLRKCTDSTVVDVAVQQFSIA